MQSGLLTGKFDLTKLAPDDWRRKSGRFAEPDLSIGHSLVEQLRPIAWKYGKTVGQLAIAWVLRNDAVTSAIVGARRAQQVVENVGGTGWALAAEDIAAIGKMLDHLQPPDPPEVIP
jgi:aryl-alcohol dehydrogenase-like predicted oxidoreductase